MHIKRYILIEIRLEIRMTKFWKAINESFVTSAEFPFKSAYVIYGWYLEYPLDGGSKRDGCHA